MYSCEQSEGEGMWALGAIEKDKIEEGLGESWLGMGPPSHDAMPWIFFYLLCR